MKTYKCKLIRLLLCFIAFTAILSCGKEIVDNNNEEGSNNANIVGTWGCVNSYEHYWGMSWNNNYTEIVPYETEYTDFWKGDVINLKDDGTYTASDDISFFDDHGGHWMKDENKLIIDRNPYEIELLNSSTLKLKYTETSAGQETEVFNTYITIEFSRQ